MTWRRGLQWGIWLLAGVVFIIAVAPIPEGGPPGSDKVEHFLAFVVLTLGAGLAYPRTPLWLPAAMLIAYGGLIELVQGLPFVGRDCSLWDWLTDIAGVMAGVAVLALSRLRARMRVS
jgi:VanZ family protein